MHFSRQVKDFKFGREHGNYANDPFFSSTFTALTVCVTFISEFENTQNSLSCGPLFGSFWSVEYLNLWPKATDSEHSKLY